MEVALNSRRLSRVLQASIAPHSLRFLSPDAQIAEAPHVSPQQSRNLSTFPSQSVSLSGIRNGSQWSMAGYGYQLCTGQHFVYMMTPRACFATAIEEKPTDAVKEVYDKMLESVNARTMPPNVWLWSLIEKCANLADIKLLFDILQTLRIFRLSNLRIHANFNCNLCREVAKACARVGAVDFGKKALCKHNVYGLTPSIGSAHRLLLYAKEHNDAELMADIMKHLKRNDLPLQAGTADIVFSICYNTDNWTLLSKYSKKFVKAGVKLRQTTFDTWMDFAARRGDVDTLWKIEKLRSDAMKQHSLASGLSCAKGFILERKPDNAAATIQILNQILSDAKRPLLMNELQKLVTEWPLEVIKHQKEEDRKALATALQADIPVMVSCLLSSGLEANLNVEDLTKKAELC